MSTDSCRFKWKWLGLTENGLRKQVLCAQSNNAFTSYLDSYLILFRFFLSWYQAKGALSSIVTAMEHHRPLLVSQTVAKIHHFWYYSPTASSSQCTIWHYLQFSSGGCLEPLSGMHRHSPLLLTTCNSAYEIQSGAVTMSTFSWSWKSQRESGQNLMMYRDDMPGAISPSGWGVYAG